MEGSLLVYSGIVIASSVAYAGAEFLKTRRGIAGIALVALAMSVETSVFKSADLTVVPGLIVFVGAFLYMAAEEPAKSTVPS